MNNVFDKKFYKYLLGFLCCMFVICWFPYLFTNFGVLDLTGVEGANIGNAINGMMGPFVAMLAAFMTFVAFWMQYKTHVQQREDISQERYVNNFMKLIDIYREIVNTINLEDKIKGRPAFHFIFYEFKSIYSAVHRKYIGFEDIAVLYISFEIFMSGIVEKGNPVLNNRIVELLRKKGHTNLPCDFQQKLDELERELIQANANFQNTKEPPMCFRVEKYREDMVFPNLYKGYMDKLTSYFNITYLVLTFLNANKNITPEVKTLKESMFSMQLTNHEISLIVMYMYYIRYRDEGKPRIQECPDITFLEDLNKRFPNTFYWKDPRFIEPDN